MNLDIFPHHMPLEIWVEAHNKLGRIESGHLSKDADSFGKLNLFVSFAVIFMVCSDLPSSLSPVLYIY